MDYYIKYLIEQYKKARGLSYININSMEFKMDFDKWLKQNQINGINYAAFLYSIGIDITTPRTAEVNKGMLDSIVLPYETTIISPYINDNYRNNINNSSFCIFGGKPYYDNFKNYIYRYIIQNSYLIYDYSDLMNWKKMHELTHFDIVYGIYGNLYDYDREEKMKQLDLLKRNLSTPYIVEHDIFNDSYYYVVASKPKKKNKKRY